MPGVPSGRGCEACRKQKKKCDQAKPVCSRCARLEIECIGCGQQRFKFVNTSKSQLVYKPKSHTQSSQPTFLACEKILWSPSNEWTMILGEFCSALQITDARYDLSVYGPFFKDIPRRLGEGNAALDFSVRAITTTYSAIHNKCISVEALTNYGEALKVLRNTLNDPVQARSANTLCAMYLMMVCQGWIGEKDDCTSHGEVFAYFLSTLDPRDFQATFDDNLLMTLCVPVIVESLANPKLQLHPWLENLTEARDNACPMESLKLRNLGKIPDFIQHPEPHLAEMKSIYKLIKEELAQVRMFLISIVEQDKIDRTLHCQYQMVYGIQLSFAMVLNVLLRSFGIGNLVGMLDECSVLVNESITIAEDARQYRPLGSSGIPTTLVCAWAATVDMVQRQRLEELMDEYQEDSKTANWKNIAVWIYKKLMVRDFLHFFTELSVSGAELELPGQEAPPILAECCVM